MFTNNIFNIVLVIFVVIIACKLYFDSDAYNLRCIISDVNGNKYCVRDRNKLELAADRLAHVNNNLNKLVNHLAKKWFRKNLHLKEKVMKADLMKIILLINLQPKKEDQRLIQMT